MGTILGQSGRIGRGFYFGWRSANLLLFCEVKAALLALLIACGCWNSAQASDLPERVERPLTAHGFASIHYPPEFDPEKSYSVLYWFHGTGGRPNPGIGNGHEKLISVGMSYLKRDPERKENTGTAHWNECLAVRKELESEGLKLDRNIVAGMSKGGWMSFYVAAEPRESLHAVGIFAAGKDPNMKSTKSLKGRNLSVLIGTGETDPNYPQAQLAVKVLKEAGAQVFYEEWLGEGHTYHRGGRVRHWLDVESRRSDPAELLKFCAAGISAELAKAEAWKDEKDRYVALRILIGDPRLPEADSASRKRLKEAGMELATDASVKDWKTSLARLRTLVGEEAKFFARRDFDVGKIGELVAAYRKLVEELKHPDLAARAAYGHFRTKKMLTIYTAQMEARKNPEYQELWKEWVQLQTIYGETEGQPGPDVMKRLNEVGARLGELRHESSMSAFRNEEWGDGSSNMAPEIRAAIEAGEKASEKKPKAFSGIAF